MDLKKVEVTGKEISDILAGIPIKIYGPWLKFKLKAYLNYNKTIVIEPIKGDISKIEFYSDKEEEIPIKCDGKDSGCLKFLYNNSKFVIYYIQKQKLLKAPILNTCEHG